MMYTAAFKECLQVKGKIMYSILVVCDNLCGLVGAGKPFLGYSQTHPCGHLFGSYIHLDPQRVNS